MLAVPFSHALAQESKAIQGPKEESGWEFLKKNISAEDYKEFEEIAGKNQIARSIPCGGVGSRKCYLATSVCMVKITKLDKKEREKYKGAKLLDSQVLDEKGKHLYEYACIPNKDDVKKRYKKLGYTEKYYTEKGTKNKKKCFIATTTDGKVSQYCISYIGGNLSVEAANAKGRGCDVVNVAWYNNTRCLFCPIIGGIFAAADNITVVSQMALARSFAIVIALGLLVWIAMKTLVFVSSMTKQDGAKYIGELIKQSYKFMIAFFVLMYYQDVFTFIIEPLLKGGLRFSQEFVAVETISDRFNKVIDADTLKTLGVEKLDVATLKTLDIGKLNEIKPDYAQNLQNTFYSFETYTQLENFAYNVNKSYALLQTIGGSLFCMGWQYALGRFGEWEFGLGFSCMIYGAMFAGFGFLLCMAFIFYMLDAVVQLGIVGGLLPFLIASWPFKITSKYTSTGFKMLLNSIFTFMVMGFVVKITLLLISSALQSNIKTTAEDGNIAQSGGLIALMDAINSADTDALRSLVNVFSVGFCIFIFVNIMGFLLLSKVAELTNRFASGGMKGAAPSIATMGASAIKGAVSKAAAPTSKAVGKWAEDKVTQGANALGRALTLKGLRDRMGGSKSTKGNRPTEATLGSGGAKSGEATLGNKK